MSELLLSSWKAEQVVDFQSRSGRIIALIGYSSPTKQHFVSVTCHYSDSLEPKLFLYDGMANEGTFQPITKTKCLGVSRGNRLIMDGLVVVFISHSTPRT